MGGKDRLEEEELSEIAVAKDSTEELLDEEDMIKERSD